MGHLTHPIASRLGFTSFWNSISIAPTSQYTSFSLEDFFFQKLFIWFYKRLQRDNFIVTHVIVSRFFKKLLFTSLLYNADLDFKWLSLYRDFLKRLEEDKVDYEKEDKEKKAKVRSQEDKDAINTEIEDLNYSTKLFFSNLRKTAKMEQRFALNPNNINTNIDFAKRGNRAFFDDYKGFKFFYFYKRLFKSVFYHNKSFIPKNFGSLSSKLSNKHVRLLRFFIKQRKGIRYRQNFFFKGKRTPFAFRRKSLYKRIKQKIKIQNSHFSLRVFKKFFLRSHFEKNFNFDKKKIVKLNETSLSVFDKLPPRNSFYKKRRAFFNRANYSAPAKDLFFSFKKEFFNFYKRFINYIKYFYLLNNFETHLMDDLQKNTQGFLNNLFFWRLNDFKIKLFGFFTNISLTIATKIGFIFFFLTSGAFSAALICKYIVVRLHQGALLFDIIKPLISKLLFFERMTGFKISCAGRFSRRQIAAYSWQSRGELPLNSFGRVIDYFHSHAFLNNSVCGLKVWLCFSEKFLTIKKTGFLLSGNSFCL